MDNMPAVGGTRIDSPLVERLARPGGPATARCSRLIASSRRLRSSWHLAISARVGAWRGLATRTAPQMRSASSMRPATKHWAAVARARSVTARAEIRARPGAAVWSDPAAAGPRTHAMYSRGTAAQTPASHAPSTANRHQRRAPPGRDPAEADRDDPLQ